MSSVIFEYNCVDNLVTRLTKEKILINNGKIILGFLIGHHLADVDYVVHLVRCSDKFGPLFDNVESVELKEVEAGPKTSNRPLDEEVILLHGRQILRMLPGGSDIVGLFAFGQKKDLLENQAFIMRLSRRLVQLRNEMSNFDQFQPTLTTSKSGDSSRFLLMNRDSASTKITVTTLKCDLSSANCVGSLNTISTSSPFLERRIQYVTFGCSLNLDLQSYSTVVFRANNGSSSTAQSHDFESQCHDVLRPFFQRLRTACITFDGSLHDDYDVCPADTKPVQARILLPEESTADDSSVKQQSCLSKMHLKGNLVCKIQLPSKCTFSEASVAIKQDLARGLRARIQLHAEGANVVEGEELAVEAFHRLPRRVYLSLLEQQQQTPMVSNTNRRTAKSKSSPSSSVSAYSSPLLACDYLFEAETVDDAAINFADVFDLDLQHIDLHSLSEKVADQLELVPDECKLLAGEALDFSFRDQGADIHRTSSLTGGASSSSMESVEQLIEMENKLLQSNRWTLVYVCTAVLIALVACLFYLLFYSNAN